MLSELARGCGDVEWNPVMGGRDELHNVPVQMANVSAAHFWRLRETQALVDWLRSLPARLVSAEAVRAWLAERPSGRWWSLLCEAVDAYTLEAGLAEAPVDHVLAWLAEWGREIRRAQSGLLLLTARRAYLCLDNRCLGI